MHRVSMVLQQDRHRFGSLHQPGACLGRDLPVAMDRHPVVQHRDAGIGDLVALAVESRSSEPDVIGLPGKRRQTHVHIRRLLAVKRPALVEQPF